MGDMLLQTPHEVKVGSFDCAFFDFFSTSHYGKTKLNDIDAHMMQVLSPSHTITRYTMGFWGKSVLLSIQQGTNSGALLQPESAPSWMRVSLSESDHPRGTVYTSRAPQRAFLCAI